MPEPTVPARASTRFHRRAGALTVLSLLVSLLALVPATTATAMPIEGYPTYQPQHTCSPRPKPGTVRLAEHLLERYPGSSSSGISRSCGNSGVSEHKEGRAFDWRLDARSARDRGYARDFLDRIFATDKAGNGNALARRMGIMYVIWADKIWAASSQYRRRAYLHAACGSRESCSKTLRHRDHMHISLTWRGARARTSWYTGVAPTNPAPAPSPEVPTTPVPPRPEVPTTPPQPPAPPVPVEPVSEVVDLSRNPVRRISVPVDGSVTETEYLLRGGRTYKITAAGLSRYGTAHQVTDATCTWARKLGTWSPKPGKRRPSALNLMVNGRSLFGEECRGGHVYQATLTPKRNVPLRLWVKGRREADGRLTVVLSKRATQVAKVLPTYPALVPAPTVVGGPPSGFGLLQESVTVPAAARSVLTSYALRKGDRYRVTVSGVATLGPGVESDGRCVSIAGRWYPQASMDLRVPGDDHGNLYLDGSPFGRRRGGCDEHTHSVVHTAERTGRLRLALWDPLTTSDNNGSLAVRVQRLTPFAAPERGPWERPRPRKELWRMTKDRFKVRPGNRSGVVSTMRVRKGERVRVVVSGTHRSNAMQADATCVRAPQGWVTVDPRLELAQDPLELYVEGRPLPWRPVGAESGCSPEHVYKGTVVAQKNGPLRLGVLDLDHRDNAGGLDVTLVRIAG